MKENIEIQDNSIENQGEQDDKLILDRQGNIQRLHKKSGNLKNHDNENGLTGCFHLLIKLLCGAIILIGIGMALCGGFFTFSGTDVWSISVPSLLFGASICYLGVKGFGKN